MSAESLHPNFHLGTASWSSEDWRGPFYPEKMPPREFLPFYAERFDTVEVDSTFYRPPSAYLIRKWRSDTPEGFRFSLKVPRLFTHDKVLQECEKEFETFTGTVAELGERLKFLLFQFGYFNKNSACPGLGAFLERLDRFLSTAPRICAYAVEVRNARWIGGELFDFLRERKVVLALAEQQWMPRIPKLWEHFGERLLTGDAAYIRLIGERKRIEAMSRCWDRVVIDREQELRELIPFLKELAKRGVDVWTYFNNHYAGYAPGSIEMLRRLWGEG